MEETTLIAILITTPGSVLGPFGIQIQKEDMGYS
jgi:hypothetical protein